MVRPCSEITILLVDFDEPFRTGLAQMLRDDGHQVLDFASPADVPPLEDLHHVEMVIVEYLLPGEHGIALAKRFHRVHPRLPVLLVSVYLGGRFAEPDRDRDFVHTLSKPIDYDHLHLQIHRLVR